MALDKRAAEDVGVGDLRGLIRLRELLICLISLRPAIHEFEFEERFIYKQRKCAFQDFFESSIAA